MIIKMLYTIEIIQYEIKTRENGRVCMTVLHTRYYVYADHLSLPSLSLGGLQQMWMS